HCTPSLSLSLSLSLSHSHSRSPHCSSPFLVQLQCSGKEDVVLQVDVGMEIVFKVLEHLEQQSIRYAGVRGKCVVVGQVTNLFHNTAGLVVFVLHHGNGRLYRAEPRRSVALYEFPDIDRKSTRLNSSHVKTSNAVFCLKKKN